MMRNLLAAIRANATATIQMVDGLLELIDATEQAAAAPPPPIEYSATSCEHPVDARRAIPRMGAPNAFVCRLCGQTGGTEEAMRGTTPEKEG
jgi:hypothetical protein